MPKGAASIVAGCLLAVASCATQSATRAAAPQPHPAAEPAAETPPKESSPRALSQEATFGDLVRVARNLASSELASSTAGCLLGRDGAGYMLAADLMPSLERMPDPPTDLGARFERGAEPFAVLSAWGIAGKASAATVLASFSATSPSALGAEPVLLVLDAERAFVRMGNGGAAADAAELTPSAAVARVKQLTTAGSTLYITATAGFGLDELTRVLAQLDATPPQLDLALAVLLPTDTVLPSAAPSVSAEQCPTGLPEVDETTPLGDLARDAVMPALSGLQRDVATCLASLRVRQTRVVVALRVGASGSVQRACFLDDGELDPRTASCVLLVAGALQTAPPNPAGVVDLHLPLTLSNEAPAPQRALCPAQ